MKRFTHLISGIAVGSATASLSGGEPISLIVLGGFFGIFPDFVLIFSGLSRRVHRSAASHSLLASVLFALAWAVLLISVSGTSQMSWLDTIPLLPSTVVVFMASFVHTLEDSLTFQGCKLFYPLSRRRYKGVVRFDDVVVNAILIVIGIGVTLFFLQMDLYSLGKL
ncbi:MAG: metal-dependent hydrolase [Thermoplasmata archaeon]|nr:metal-dependent hydrolase [Thermoplasmata archaeon]